MNHGRRDRRGRGRVRRSAWIAALGALAAWGCASPAPKPVVANWVVGQALPTFDPQGPPDAVRWAIERLLSTGLMEEDSSGRVIPAAAESVRVSADGLMISFRLRHGLTFADGTPCKSAAFGKALEAGLNRLDHATHAWLLRDVTGVDRVRAGRPLPPLGIATPDDRSLVLRLSRPDPDLLRKLALPGVGTPWREGGGEGWRDGIGRYAIVGSAPTRLVLARRGTETTGPDTLVVRFVPSSRRVRALLRAGAADLVWPPPPDLLDEELPAGFRARAQAARPARHLLLVMRADLPPTSKVEARLALSHGLQRSQLVATLGRSGDVPGAWLSGAPRFEFPRQDPEAVRLWLERGRFRRSLHAVMAYSADGVGAQIARAMQVDWAGLGLDVELRPVRQPEAAAELMRPGGAQLLLVESQPLLDDAAAALATLVRPMRGPEVGSFRTGWATRAFDRWIMGSPGAPPLDLDWAQQRLADERVALPLARLPWVWVERAAGGFHPRYGPDPASRVPPATARPR